MIHFGDMQARQIQHKMEDSGGERSRHWEAEKGRQQNLHERNEELLEDTTALKKQKGTEQH